MDVLFVVCGEGRGGSDAGDGCGWSGTFEM